MHRVPSSTMPKRNVEHVPPLLALTDGFSFVSPLSTKGSSERDQWQVGMTKCSLHAGMTLLVGFPLSVCLVSWIRLLMCTVPHLAPSSPTQNWSNFLCFFLCEWRETPLQCECLTLQCTLCLCDWVLPHHHIICTLCRSTQLHCLVCNSCATHTVAGSILSTL